MARQTNEDERLQNQAASARRKEDDAVAAKYVHTAVHAGARVDLSPPSLTLVCVFVCVFVCTTLQGGTPPQAATRHRQEQEATA